MKENIPIEELVNKAMRRSDFDYNDIPEIMIRLAKPFRSKVDAEFQLYLTKQLERTDLIPLYRNILIMCLHTRYELVTQNISLSSSLPSHIKKINKVKEKMILIQALELFSSFASDFEASLFADYISKDNDFDVKRCALKGIQNLFSEEPLDIENFVSTLSTLRSAVVNLSSEYIPQSYETDGLFTGNLGIDPILTSALLYDINLPRYMEEYANNTTLDWEKF